MTLVLGLDSSTQSTKAMLVDAVDAVDAVDGTVVASRTAPHPPGPRRPAAWLQAAPETAADLLGRANAVAVGGQQHGMVALDADGGPDPDALFWDDTRSAAAATELVAETGEVAGMSDAVGSVPVAWFTVTKRRWLRDPSRSEPGGPMLWSAWKM